MIRPHIQPQAWLNMSWGDYLYVGTHHLMVYSYYSYDEPTHERYVPKITWQADRFEEWILPDPTMGGVFPGMTDARFKQVFGVSADGWEKTTTWWLW